MAVIFSINGYVGKAKADDSPVIWVQLYNTLTDIQRAVEKFELGVKGLSERIDDRNVTDFLKSTESGNDEIEITIGVNTNLVHGNVANGFVAAGGKDEVPFQSRNLSAVGWYVTSIQTQLMSVPRLADTGRANIDEAVFGTLYTFPNASFVYWPHTDLGEKRTERFQINLERSDGLRKQVMVVVTAEGESGESSPSLLCRIGSEGKGTPYPDYLGTSMCDASVILSGLEGDDVIFGTKNPDNIDGGPGNDLLIGNLGKDAFSGGQGADVFILATKDYENGTAIRIEDFKCSEGDVIDIRWQIEYDVFKDDLPLSEKAKFWSIAAGEEPDAYVLSIDPDAEVKKYQKKVTAYIRSTENLMEGDLIERGCLDPT